MRISKRELMGLGAESFVGNSPRLTRRQRRAWVLNEVATAAQEQVHGHTQAKDVPPSLTRTAPTPPGLSDPDAAEEQPTAATPCAPSSLQTVPVLATAALKSSLPQAGHENLPTDANPSAKSDIRECTVCYDSHPVEDFPGIEDCQHERTVCRNCFTKWLSNEVGRTAALSDVKCPCYDQKCKVPITYSTAKQYATSETFARYDELTLREALRDDPNFQYCIAPGCSVGQYHDPEAGNVFTCGACGDRHCTTHHIPFHDGESCKQYDQRVLYEKMPLKEQIEASLVEVKKSSVKCPGEKCGYRIQKTSGCDHMTCSRRRHEFCYLCQAPYAGEQGIRRLDNSAHAPTCRYYSSASTGRGVSRTLGPLINQAGPRMTSVWRWSRRAPLSQPRAPQLDSQTTRLKRKPHLEEKEDVARRSKKRRSNKKKDE